MIRLLDPLLIVVAASVVYSGHLDASHRTQTVEQGAPLKASTSCLEKDQIRQGTSLQLGSERGCALSTEIDLRDRWSTCLGSFVRENWLDSTLGGLSGKRAARRIFHNALRSCQSEGEALRSFVGDKTFREERNYQRDMIVESLALSIEEERVSAI